MNRFLTTIIAFLLTFAAAFADTRPMVELEFQQIETLDQVPAWSVANLLISGSKKTSEHISLNSHSEDTSIAPIECEQSQVHHYYLPIYNLVRQKEYFLLI